LFIIPIEQRTLEVIAAINNGVRPDIEEEHTSFIYHDETRPTEIVPTAMIGPVLRMEEYRVMELPIIVLDV
jgi:hypothetical protein